MSRLESLERLRTAVEALRGATRTEDCEAYQMEISTLLIELEGLPRPVVSLKVARMQKAGDATLWTVPECLEEALRESTSDHDWDKCLMIFSRQLPNGNWTTDYRIAGCTLLEARGLLLTEIIDHAHSKHRG